MLPLLRSHPSEMSPKAAAAMVMYALSEALRLVARLSSGTASTSTPCSLGVARACTLDSEAFSSDMVGRKIAGAHARKGCRATYMCCLEEIEARPSHAK